MINVRIDKRFPPDMGLRYDEQKLDKVPFIIPYNGKEYTGSYLLLKGYRRIDWPNDPLNIREIDCKIDDQSNQWELFKLICDAKSKIDELSIFVRNIEFHLKNVSVCGAEGTILTLSTDWCVTLFK